MPKAASLAEAIEQQVGIKPELIEGRGGVFDVKADGQLIYSKHASGDRFPEHEEVISKLRELATK